ncbi:MAG: CDP-alcohol phosphatidyltransferase family protein [Planctomycetota bacterium]|nr:CDP-alcohol phosphatidyltransferase family protein [Planctomycetota bacterium]
MSWPNRITVLRILLVTPFVVLLLNAADGPGYRYGALALAIFIGVCDAADGIIARRTGTVSKIGSILDPLADYAFMISALSIMSMRGVLSENPDIRLPYWFSVTLIARSVFLLVGIFIVHFMAGFSQGLPTASGKTVTVMQFVVVGLMFLAPDLLAWFPDTMWTILYVLWGLTVFVGVVSWLSYLRTGSKILTVGGHGK